MEEKGVQKDADMARNTVRNKYEYAVLKIQKWWRRRNLSKVITLKQQTLKKAARRRVGLDEQIRYIEFELNDYLKNQANNFRLGKMQKGLQEFNNGEMQKKTPMELIQSCQRRVRMNTMIRKARKRFAKSDNHVIVYKGIKEFKENELDIFPSNYLITISLLHELSFEVEMVLNNKPDLDKQRHSLQWDLARKPAEVDRMNMLGQFRYFRELIEQRLLFSSDTYSYRSPGRD